MKLSNSMILLVLASSVAGCGAEGESYALPAKEVRSSLLSLKPPMFVFGNSANLSSMVSQYGQDQVRWTLINDGKPQLSFTATVTPDGEAATLVALALDPPTGREDSQIARNMASNPAIIDLYKAAMVEQIDSRLERRNFDMSAIKGQMMTAAVANIGEMQAAVAESARNSETMMRNIEADLADAQDAHFDEESRQAIAGELDPDTFSSEN